MKLYAIVYDIGWQDTEQVLSVWTDKALAYAALAREGASSQYKGMAPTLVVEFDADVDNGLADALGAAAP